MSILTLLLASLFAGVLGLLFKSHRQRFFSPVFVFPMRMLLSELKKNGFWNWRNLFRHQGSIPISDLKLCQKILNHPAWPDRVKTNSLIHLSSYGKPLGLIHGCGHEYKVARRMSSRVLNHIGFHNTSHLEQLVSTQVTRLLRNVGDLVGPGSSDNNGVHKGILWCPKRKLSHFALHITWEILFGRKLPNHDATIEAFLSYIHAANRNFSKKGGFSWNRGNNPISKLFGPFARVWACYKGSDYICGAAKEILHSRREKPEALLQGSNNFLDAYLLNLNGTKNFDTTDEELLVTVRDLMIGTGETVGSILEFAILHLALNPSVQEGLWAEIDHIVGRSRHPLYSDRASMPYTQATILEILRHGSVVSPGERVAVEDNTIDGTFYPKGTVVGIRLYEIHQSKELWDDPEAFRPERFLSTHGSRVENKGKIMPFGYGRRLCIGESLAQVAVFMFLTALVQKYCFEIPKEFPPPSLETLRGQARSPVPYFVRVFPRHDNGCL